MAAEKVLVFGRGYLGGRLTEHFEAEISPADVTDLQAVRAELDRTKPDVIINAAAKTRTADLEKPENQAEAYRVNVQGAANLALAASERGIYMVQISTAMMFDGPGITESSLPEPKSYYAWTKAWADAQLVPLMGEGVLIARIHTPLSKFASPRNLLTKLQGFSSVADVPASLTVVEDFLEALAALVQKRSSGIYNLVNPGSISMYRIASTMQEQGRIAADKVIKPASREELDRMVRESGGAFQPFPILETKKLEAEGISMRPAEEAVRACINEYQS